MILVAFLTYLVRAGGMKSILLQHLITDIVGTVLDYYVDHKEEKLNGEFRCLFTYWVTGRLFYKWLSVINWRYISADYYYLYKCQPTVTYNIHFAEIKSFVRGGKVVTQRLPERYIFSLGSSDLIFI